MNISEQHKTIDDFNGDWLDNIPLGEIEQMERDHEGGNISFSELSSLTSWLWTDDIKNAIVEHDKVEKVKIPRLQRSSLDLFKEIIFDNLKLIDNEIYGLHSAANLLAKTFDIDPYLSEIELGKLVKSKLKYKINN